MCILGPNGIGKTTVFRSVLGFLPLSVVGIAMGRLIPRARRKDDTVKASTDQLVKPPDS